MRFQKISIPTPREVIGNFEGERGGSKAIKVKYEAKLEIPRGWGVQTKKTFCGGEGGMDISGTTQWKFMKQTLL